MSRVGQQQVSLIFEDDAGLSGMLQLTCQIFGIFSRGNPDFQSLRTKILSYTLRLNAEVKSWPLPKFKNIKRLNLRKKPGKFDEKIKNKKKNRAILFCHIYCLTNPLKILKLYFFFFTLFQIILKFILFYFFFYKLNLKLYNKFAFLLVVQKRLS